jgi:hypothetical protein
MRSTSKLLSLLTGKLLSRGRRRRRTLLPVKVPAGLVLEFQLEQRETRQLIVAWAKSTAGRRSASRLGSD